MLINDINFTSTFHDTSEFKRRFQINTGISAVDGTESGDIPYANNCFKPKEGWRELSASEADVLFSSNKKPHYNRTVSIHQLPESLKSQFKSLKLTECTKRSDLLQAFSGNPEKVQNLESELYPYLKRFTTKSFEYNYLSTTPPQRETSSAFFNANNDLRLIGLHFDRSETFDLADPIMPNKNRIGINLSREERKVYFINLSVAEIRRTLIEEHQVEPSAIDMVNLMNVYYKHLRHYPVVSVVVKPYEMYIAPTDNLIHDSTTLGRNSIDVMLSYLGYFNHIETN